MDIEGAWAVIVEMPYKKSEPIFATDASRSEEFCIHGATLRPAKEKWLA
jgi:hypothetical protein